MQTHTILSQCALVDGLIAAGARAAIGAAAGGGTGAAIRATTGGAVGAITGAATTPPPNAKEALHAAGSFWTGGWLFRTLSDAPPNATLLVTVGSRRELVIDAKRW